MKRKRAQLVTMLAIILATSLAPMFAGAAAGEDILKGQCSSCHALSRPEDTGLDRLLSRKGPDLYYAGAKFNKEWLVKWLQEPAAIRPAGVMYTKVLKPGAPGTPDVIDSGLVPQHVKLSAADAAAAADALMALGADSPLVTKGAFKQQAPNASMAALLFNKLRGCSSCHAAKAGPEPHSGPELFSAGDRLQPDYIAEYIRDPQKFDAHVWMPKLELTDGDIQKLTGYLMTLRQAGAK